MTRRQITVRRLPSGRYHASGWNPTDHAEWDPRRKLPHQAEFLFGASDRFRRELRQLDLGRACWDCGYLEVEHNITGEEKAPCGGYRGPNR